MDKMTRFFLYTQISQFVDGWMNGRWWWHIRGLWTAIRERVEGDMTGIWNFVMHTTKGLIVRYLIRNYARHKLYVFLEYIQAIDHCTNSVYILWCISFHNIILITIKLCILPLYFLFSGNLKLNFFEIFRLNIHCSKLKHQLSNVLKCFVKNYIYWYIFS